MQILKAKKNLDHSVDYLELNTFSYQKNVFLPILLIRKKNKPSKKIEKLSEKSIANWFLLSFVVVVVVTYV